VERYKGINSNSGVLAKEPIKSDKDFDISQDESPIKNKPKSGL
jgi:hypothetical protein